jgi:CheY-like chemotaxis protein
VATILYIEDDEAIRQLVRLILERRSGIELHEAETGREGLSLASSVRPDLILLDISLPDMDGSEVLRLLRNSKDTASTPIIAISGNSVIETKQTIPGFQHYLAKPINIQDLYTSIDSFIE